MKTGGFSNMDPNDPLRNYNIQPSKSFVVELEKQLKSIVSGIFGELMVWKQVHFNFKEDSRSLDMNGTKFSFGYWSMYGFRCILFTKNQAGDEPIDCRDEVKPGSVEFSLEFEPGILESAKKLMREYLAHRKIKVLEWYRFPVKIYSHGIDVEVKILFARTLSIEELESFLSKLAVFINQFNQESLKVENFERGLIHNHSLLKVNKRAGKTLVLSVDTGSSGEFGLEYLFKSLNEGNYDISSIQVN